MLEHNGVPNVLLRLLEDSALVELLEEEEELVEVNPPLAAGTAQSTTFSGIPLSDCSGCGILGTRLRRTLADRDIVCTLRSYNVVRAREQEEHEWTQRQNECACSAFWRASGHSLAKNVVRMRCAKNHVSVFQRCNWFRSENARENRIRRRNDGCRVMEIARWLFFISARNRN